ncbi:MAG: lysophospholipid acyltransferase family protein, partial [Rhodospirillaceae bacterium]
REGALALARLSGVPIVPAAVSVRRRIVLRTWDRLIIALPFSRGAMVWGTPVAVPRDADDAMLKHLQDHLERELNRITAEADAMVGHTPIEPAHLENSHARA